MNKLLTTPQLAELLGVDQNTCEKWRYRGEGPRFIRIGGRIAYDPDDVKAWLDSQKVGSTSEAA